MPMNIPLSRISKQSELPAAAALFLALLLAAPATAATRAVQFAGMAVNDPLTAELSNWSFMTYCNLAVTNMSTTDQRISKVEFMAYEFKETSPTVARSVTNTFGGGLVGFASWKGDMGSTSCVGTGTSLAPGDVCVMRYPVQTFTWSGKMAICSGKITIEDVDATKPGSVIATGSLYLNQEAMVLGGQLSGAFYASQTHVMSSDFGSTKPLKTIPPLPSGYSFSGAQNMNVFCGAACMSSSNKKSAGWTDEECNRHCGLGNAADTDSWTSHISGWTSKVSNQDYHEAGSEKTQNADQVSLNDGSEFDEHVQIVDALHRMDRLRVHSVANAHFASGMVYEMQIGAFNAICSAHNQYSKDGGLEFKHSDGVDSHAVYDSNAAYSNAPPERLVCAHRHMKPDLFMRVGSTSPIVVNGGMPF